MIRPCKLNLSPPVGLEVKICTVVPEEFFFCEANLDKISDGVK
jgi:hypothetical protein